jgi:ribosomal-protein-alanine N-acetyltransferase
LTCWDPTHHKASLGYVLAESAWGHGYATEAGRAVLQWVFGLLRGEWQAAWERRSAP